MKALSFLGLGNPKTNSASGYEQTVYTLADKSVATEYFPLFMLEAFRPEQMVLFVTGRIRQERLPWFLEAVPPEFRSVVRTVDIQDGASQAELWSVFTALVDNVDVNETIVMDITHGFRSLPMLALVAAQYLKVTKKVSIVGIYYGAYEARSQGQTPVFDLTPFVDLMDWTSALSLFNQTGNGAGIARILEATQNQFYKGRQAVARPTQLRRFGGYLEGISRDLLHLKTRTAMHNISRLSSVLKDAEDEITSYAPPLAHVLNSAVRDIVPMGHAETNTLTREFTAKQMLEVRWYIEHGHYVHALGLFREVLINMACLILEEPEPFNYDRGRKRVDAFVGYMAAEPARRDEAMQQRMSEETAGYVRVWAGQQLAGDAAAWWEQLGKCFSWLRNNRNALMHAEMTSEQINVDTLRRDIDNRLAGAEELLQTMPEPRR